MTLKKKMLFEVYVRWLVYLSWFVNSCLAGHCNLLLIDLSCTFQVKKNPNAALSSLPFLLKAIASWHVSIVAFCHLSY